ncbi:MAG TPA: FG-GAP-like repeat-containing protein [Candidatus Eisenbacteria bacterium]|nr:FG-GAP-like repeat-containing protein [Candidatus Eisenbacteria bacterium]
MRFGRPRLPAPLRLLSTSVLALTAILAVAAFGFATAHAADQACITFSAPHPVAFGGGGSGIATGDFNEDGILDLAIAQGARDSVCVMLGLGSGGVGSGGFATPVRYYVGSFAKAIAVGDFNDDGRLDLAISLGSSVGIMLGQGTGSVGNGTFAAPVPYTAGTNPQGIVAADFNEDGILDLAVANAGSNNVSILIGNGANGVGNGTFAAPVNYAVGVSPIGVVAFDQDGDGILDLAVSNNSSTSNSISLLMGQGSGGRGDGTFAAAVSFASGPNPAGIVAADFDENGHPDLAVACGGDSSVCVYINVGTKAFNPRVRYVAGTGARGLVAADFTGDGIVDLAVSDLTAGNVAFLAGNGSSHVGNGTFAARTLFPAGTQPMDLVAGDFHEDGIADLVTVNAGSSNVTWLQGGCGSAATAITVTSPAAGDLALIGTERSIAWTEQTGISTVNVDLSLDGGSNWRTIASRIDATTFTWSVPPTKSGTARIRVYDPDVVDHVGQSGDFEICSVLDSARTSAGLPSAAYMAVADFNEDGLLDIAYTSGSNVAVELQQVATPAPGMGVQGLLGSGRFGSPTLYPGAASGGIAVGDFDGDGILDIAAADGLQIVIFKGNGSGGVGDGTFAPARVAVTTSAQLKAVATADVNEDGILDLLATDQTSHVYVSLGLGSAGVGDGLFAAPTSYTTGSGPFYMAVGDVNRDGIVDVVTSNTSAGSVSVLLGQGSGGHGNGTFGAPTSYAVSGPRQPEIGDFNHDGVPDLAVACATAHVSVLLGQSSGGVPTGTFAAAVNYTAPSGQPTGIGVADFDRDGIADIVTSNFLTKNVGFLRGNGTGGVGSGSFTSMTLWPGSTSSLQALAVDDFNNDLIPDVVALDFSTGQAQVLFGACGVHSTTSSTVTAPAGSGTFWLVGTEQTINWNPGLGVGAVDIDVSRDNGANWQTVATRVVSPPYVWTVTGPATAAARVRVRDDAAHFNVGTSTAFSIGFVSGVNGPARASAALSPAWPNPSSGRTSFVLSLPAREPVDVAVFDVRGARVRTLADGALDAGEHALGWDGTDDRGARLSAGLYFVRARTWGFDALRRVIRIR